MNTPNDRTEPVPVDAGQDTSVLQHEHDDIRVERRPDTVAMPVVAERQAVAPIRARGGVSFWSVMSGVLVAFGAFIVLSAIVSAILIATGAAEAGLASDDLTTATIGAGIGLVVVQFLAYMWGGYTAGRMARGSGVGNGLLVAAVALVVVTALGAIIAAVTGTTPESAAADMQRLPLPLDTMTEIGTGVGIGVLLAMLLGGALGGMLGQRWHSKLEDAEMSYPTM